MLFATGKRQDPRACRPGDQPARGPPKRWAVSPLRPSGVGHGAAIAGGPPSDLLLRHLLRERGHGRAIPPA